jgi:hypothetical protein
MGAIGLAMDGVDPTGIGPSILVMIFIVPAILSLLILFVACIFFFQSEITGVPSDFLISIAYFVKLSRRGIKRSWRGIVGVSLIVGALAGATQILRWVWQV